MRKIIHEAWERHRNGTIPDYAFPAYAKDHLLSFYAGAGSVIAAITKALKPDEDGNVDGTILTDLFNEFVAFKEELEEKVPKINASRMN